MKALVVGLFGALALVCAACGGDDDEGGAAGAAGSAAGAAGSAAGAAGSAAGAAGEGGAAGAAGAAGEGGAAGAAGSGSGIACSELCAHTTAPACPNDKTEAECLESCGKIDQAVGMTKCNVSWEAYKGCILGSKLSCDPNGYVVVVCETEGDTLSKCISGK